jgi:hypothetical protein
VGFATDSRLVVDAAGLFGVLVVVVKKKSSKVDRFLKNGA